MAIIDLDKANAEMYEEIHDLKQQIVELKNMNIENIQYKDKIDNLIEKGVLNEDGEEIVKFLVLCCKLHSKILQFDLYYFIQKISFYFI